jgi:hypothetical protein
MRFRPASVVGPLLIAGRQQPRWFGHVAMLHNATLTAKSCSRSTQTCATSWTLPTFRKMLVETIHVVGFDHWFPWKVFMAMTYVRGSSSVCFLARSRDCEAVLAFRRASQAGQASRFPSRRFPLIHASITPAPRVKFFNDFSRACTRTRVTRAFRSAVSTNEKGEGFVRDPRHRLRARANKPKISST